MYYFLVSLFLSFSLLAQSQAKPEYAVIKGSCTVTIKSTGTNKKKKNSSLKYNYVMNPLEIDKEEHSEEILKKAFEAYLKDKHKESKVEVSAIKLFKTQEEAKKHTLTLLKDRAKRTYMTSTFLRRYMRENPKKKSSKKTKK